jgi:RNA polymerase sigma-70 factor, ECF subfamily
MKSVSSDLPDKIKAGDVKAYRELFDTFHTDLCRFAMQYVRDEDIAKEIVQDFFVNFWIKREALSINSSLSSYLYSSIRHRSLNYLRDNKRFSKLELNEEIPDNTNNNFALSGEIDAKDLNKNILEAIEELPPKCRTVFKLSREEELTYKEIAEKLNISIKTVETQMGIAFKKLREKLKPLFSMFPVFIFFIKIFFKQL